MKKLGLKIRIVGRILNAVTSGKKTHVGLVILLLSTILDAVFGVKLDPEIYSLVAEKALLLAQGIGGVIAVIGALHKDVKEGQLKTVVEQMLIDGRVTRAEIDQLLGSYLSGDRPQLPRPFAEAYPVNQPDPNALAGTQFGD